MEEGPAWLRPVIRRFPGSARLVETMSAQPGAFRDMCEELAEAETALRSTELAPPELREERRAEWRSAIEALMQEIEQALREANVVSLGRRTRPPPGARLS